MTHTLHDSLIHEDARIGCYQVRLVANISFVDLVHRRKVTPGPENKRFQDCVLAPPNVNRHYCKWQETSGVRFFCTSCLHLEEQSQWFHRAVNSDNFMEQVIDYSRVYVTVQWKMADYETITELNLVTNRLKSIFNYYIILTIFPTPCCGLCHHLSPCPLYLFLQALFFVYSHVGL